MSKRKGERLDHDDWVQRGINGEGPWWMFFVVFFGLWAAWGLLMWLDMILYVE